MITRNFRNIMLEDISIFVMSVLWAHNNVPVDRPPCMLHHLNTMDFSNLSPDTFADNITSLAEMVNPIFHWTFWARGRAELWQWDAVNPEKLINHWSSELGSI